MKQKSIWFAAAAVLALSAGFAPAALAAPDAAAPTKAAAAAAPAPVSLETPHYGTWGFDASGQDATVKPGTDFFLYANGEWVKRTTIPGDRVRFGNFDTLSVLSEARTRALIDDVASGKISDPDAAKVGAAYRAFMDQARVDALGAAPLAADLNTIRKERSHEDVARVMGQATKSFQSSIFDVGIGADAKAPTKYAVYTDTGGMGLPDRDYYIEAKFAPQKAAYQVYVAKMLTLAGWPNATAQAAAILDFETQIAKVSWARAEERDPDKVYNPMTPAELQAFAPGFDFKAFLRTAGLSSADRVVLGAKSAFPKVASIYAATPIETLKAWQAFHVIDAASPYLSDAFVQARFDFRGKTLTGQPQLQPRWKRAVAFTNTTLGESVGRMYVAKYFTPEAKAKMDALVGNLKAALAARIERLTWMSDETKKRAELKLSQFTVKIGYPATWRDYANLTVLDNDLYGDAERHEGYEWNRQVARLYKPVDKMEWGITPQTVNAYYNPSNNEVVFPAAILQPPFFDASADPAVNYGGIGVVIGHEMTHGFDDEGRKFDGDGSLRDWWSPEDAKKFEAQTARLGAQYDKFEPVPGVHVKGELTMGENIADLGGMLMALDAYHASLHGQPAPVIDGLTGDQRVFLGFAQVWREKIRDEAARQRAVSDPHSPAHFRVDGVLPNVDLWYSTYNIQPGDPMYVAPADRVKIW
jgi:putative endopeptidase